MTSAGCSGDCNGLSLAPGASVTHRLPWAGLGYDNTHLDTYFTIYIVLG